MHVVVVGGVLLGVVDADVCVRGVELDGRTTSLVVQLPRIPLHVLTGMSEPLHLLSQTSSLQNTDMETLAEMSQKTQPP